jgi:hypothetical protein
MSLPKDEGSIQPDVVLVGFDFDGDYFYVGGMNLMKSTKYKNVLKNNKIALVIDDLKSICNSSMSTYFYYYTQPYNPLLFLYELNIVQIAE